MTNFLRSAMTSAGSASSRLEKSDRSVRARQRIVPGGGDAEPAGSIVGFAILSPFSESIPQVRSLQASLEIYRVPGPKRGRTHFPPQSKSPHRLKAQCHIFFPQRSEEHTSELQ